MTTKIPHKPIILIALGGFILLFVSGFIGAIIIAIGLSIQHFHKHKIVAKSNVT